MSQLTKTDVIALTPENLTALFQHPLHAVPAELRPAVWSVWLLQQHLFPAPLSISAAIATDLACGLTPGDAAAILEAMSDPELRATFRFASEFMAELARRTSLAIKKRKRDREQADRRGADQGEPYVPKPGVPLPPLPPEADQARVKGLLGDFVKRFNA